MKIVERRLRIKIKFLEQELEKTQEDRQKFRDYFSQKLKYFINLTGKNEYALSASMIENLAKFFQTVKWFSW